MMRASIIMEPRPRQARFNKMQCRQEPEQARQENQDREEVAPPAGTGTTESAAGEGLLVDAGVVRWEVAGAQVVDRKEAKSMSAKWTLLLCDQLARAESDQCLGVPLRFTATRRVPDIAKRKRKESQRLKAGFVPSYGYV